MHCAATQQNVLTCLKPLSKGQFDMGPGLEKQIIRAEPTTALLGGGHEAKVGDRRVVAGAEWMDVLDDWWRSSRWSHVYSVGCTRVSCRSRQKRVAREQREG